MGISTQIHEILNYLTFNSLKWKFYRVDIYTCECYLLVYLEEVISMEKRIVGSFDSDEEVLYAIEGLKRKGHRETDMMVVAESTSAIPSHFLVRSHGRGRSTNEDLNRCCYFMLSAGMGGTQANAPCSSRLIERGLLEYTERCEEELN